MEIFEIEIDGFELLVETHNDYDSREIKIINLFDMDNIELDQDFFEMIMEDWEEDMQELIIDQIVADMGGDY